MLMDLLDHAYTFFWAHLSVATATYLPSAAGPRPRVLARILAREAPRAVHGLVVDRAAHEARASSPPAPTVFPTAPAAPVPAASLPKPLVIVRVSSFVSSLFLENVRKLRFQRARN